MKIERFEMERFQSTWENAVEINLADSGVHALTLSALVDHTWLLEVLAHEPLGYGDSNGSEELRSAIARLYHSAGTEHVLATTGTAEANFLITLALMEQGDEVIVMLPNYMQIPLLARGWGAVVKPWWLRESAQWAPDLDELDRLVTRQTKVIFVCNPNNPTGAVLNVEAMNRICTTAATVNAWVVADEVYRGAELDGHLTPSFWGRSPRVIVSSGLSKSFGLPGLRVGWIVAPHEMIDTLWGYHDYTTIAPSLLSDHLARIALGPRVHPRLASRARLILNENLAVLTRWAAEHGERLAWTAPRAGAIAFFRYAPAVNSTEFATRLRKEHSVLVVPGDHFQMDGYFRIGYGGDQAKLAEGLRRTGELLRTL